MKDGVKTCVVLFVVFVLFLFTVFIGPTLMREVLF